MLTLKEQLSYMNGQLSILKELYDYMYAKTNEGINDKISAIDILENFVVRKSELIGKEGERIQTLIPTKN